MEDLNPDETPNPNPTSSSIAASPSPSSSSELEPGTFDDADPDAELELDTFDDADPEPELEPDTFDDLENSKETPTPTHLPPTKKPKKKNNKNGNNLWTKSTSRKGKKKAKLGVNHVTPISNLQEDDVVMKPVPRLPDRSDDSMDAFICLSRVSKAERVELSEDRFTAGSTKGYRMVRATRGVMQGAWYFEIRVTHLGETGHTRLGWSTDKGDLQAPVGYDTYSYGYRDIDGSKIHKALREKYSDQGYKEGDVIGFYVNLPEGEKYAPKKPRLVCIKGQRYFYPADGKDEPPMIVPGSEILFFKNGISQGVAFRDIFGGRYYPAASMYTLPNHPNCQVTFNFGPDFDFFPEDFGERPSPRPMVEVEYHGLDYIEGPAENGVAERLS